MLFERVRRAQERTEKYNKCSDVLSFGGLQIRKTTNRVKLKTRCLFFQHTDRPCFRFQITKISDLLLSPSMSMMTSTRMVAVGKVTMRILKQQQEVTLHPLLHAFLVSFIIISFLVSFFYSFSVLFCMYIFAAESAHELI